MTSANARFVIGIDVGGTFTDLFFLDRSTGTVTTGKLPSTVADQSIGLVDGISRELDDFSDIATIVHGTTVGTNALLERKGTRTGLITTTGFEDVLEMRRRDRPHTWGLRGGYEPVIPRDLRIGVGGRVLANGSIETPLDEAAVSDAAQRLLAAGCEGVCISFINSYANPEQERRAAELVRAIWPNDHITVAADILPEIREFERLSTATLNAYLQPRMAHYLNQLAARTRDRGGDSDILIVQSNGGVMSIDAAAAQPVRTALSGPAAGVIAASHIGQSAGFDNVITCDMGGTSFDVSVIADGKTALAAQTSIDFGMVVRTPMIEITTIGAGGGSIAWIDGAGLLQIGPQSAGSDPGPVCYGLGNDKPTVTDANLLLGRINADRPIGGKLDRLDVEAARAAINTVIAEPLGIDVMDAAEAIIQVANARMAGAIRIVSIERGHDPAKFAAMPFGGGGALHIGALIREVGLNTGLVPRYPGVTSALGCVIADMRHDTVRTVNMPLASVDEAQLGDWIDDLYAASSARIASGSETFDNLEEAIEADMLFAGQTHTVQVRLGGRADLTRTRLEAAFADAYRAQIGAPLEGIPVRLVNLRLAVIARRDKLDLSVMAPVDGCSTAAARTGTRQIYAEGQWQTASIYDRLALGVGERVTGPALLEQADTTIFVDPGLVGEVDAFGNLRIERAD